MRPFEGRGVLLVVSGGIAAYKSVILARRLVEAGACVDVLMTEAAARFVGPVTFEGVTGRAVHRDLWERPMAHLDLGRRADVAVVAPATADLISRLAAGSADGLATATLLAMEGPTVVCPAMNTRMWEHPATRGNVEALRERGCRIVGPAVGPLAEGESGPGRMVEPEEILAHVSRAIGTTPALAGARVVVTAGPTRSPIDPVRFLGNRSSGRMGFALGQAAWERGADTVVISGPTSAPRPPGPRYVEVETAREMLTVLETELREARILLMAAAVGDFEAESVSPSKLRKSSGESLILALRRGPDLLLETSALRRERRIYTVGFALETADAIAHGREKRVRKGMDLIAINDANEPGAGFEVETNRVTLIDATGAEETLPLLPKREVAERILDRVEAALAG